METAPSSAWKSGTENRPPGAGGRRMEPGCSRSQVVETEGIPRIEVGTGGGARTPTSARTPDFESSASANSATPARSRAGTYGRHRRRASVDLSPTSVQSPSVIGAKCVGQPAPAPGGVLVARGAIDHRGSGAIGSGGQPAACSTLEERRCPTCHGLRIELRRSACVRLIPSPVSVTATSDRTPQVPWQINSPDGHAWLAPQTGAGFVLLLVAIPAPRSRIKASSRSSSGFSP